MRLFTKPLDQSAGVGEPPYPALRARRGREVNTKSIWLALGPSRTESAYSYNISRYYYNKPKIYEIIEFKINQRFRDEDLLKATLLNK